MKKERRMGHLAALFTILIWGTTFISTKILLADFKPIEILFFRFVIGYFVLLAPFFTAILARLPMAIQMPHNKAIGQQSCDTAKLHANFFIGFLVAMAGIILVSFQGSRLELNPVGDLLALAAAFVWACYSIPGLRI